MNTIVLYHGDCPDGQGAALAAYQKFGEEAEYIPVKYGDVFDREKFRDKIVYVLDFSLSLAVTEEIISVCQSFLIIDHHKTAMESLATIPNELKLFDMGHSGAYLAWKYFVGEPVHEMMLYLEDRDLWKWELPASREINRALQSYGLTDFRVWIPLLKGWNDKFWNEVWHGETRKVNLIEEGKAIIRQCDEFVKHTVNTAEEITFEGTSTLVANATVLFSEVPNELLKVKPPMAIGWFWDGKRQLYQVSLRSIGDFDVSVLAKRYGGGGHRNASGFTCKELPWRESFH